MSRFTSLAGAALLATCLAPASASAATVGFVTTDLNLRAGPGTQYPVVTVLPEGARVNVAGCTEGFRWCDISVRGTRGWVSGSYLELAYEDRRVYVPDYGPTIGLPIISFQLGNYWDRHYAERPWYRDRYRYGYPRYGARDPGWDRPRPGPRRDWREGDWRDRDWRDAPRVAPPRAGTRVERARPGPRGRVAPGTVIEGFGAEPYQPFATGPGEAEAVRRLMERGGGPPVGGR